ncbi:ATP-binding protein [Nitrosopumilus sp.]|uniref:sensor histidine kinase n=1 Tax=Nitrosopumilus sp. TaxID=2024843 RepID=UPI00260D9071|nr:ATP-binding protein [Nitrosopumilus sp.]
MTKAKSAEQKFNFSYFFRYTILPTVVLLVIAYIASIPDLWVVSETDHFYFEMVSVTLAVILAYYCLVRAVTFKDKFSMFVGLGFVASASIDLLHGFLTIYGPITDSVMEYFIPQTWVAGRILTALILFIGIMKFTRNLADNDKELKKSATVYSAIVSLLAVVIILISIAKPFPFIVIDLPIHRPYEIIATGISLAAIALFYRKKLNLLDNKFYNGILLLLVIETFVTLTISYSAHVFDTAFTVAHMLKNTGYLVLILTQYTSISEQYSKRHILYEKLITAHSKLEDKIKTEEELVNLKKVEKMKDEFSAMITHELRTPLTPILGNVDYLQNKKASENLTDEQKNAILSIKNNAVHLNKLISDFLDVEKLSMNKVEFKTSQFDAKKILEKIRENFEYVMTDKNITIEIKSESIDIASDKQRVQQILENLVRNACDFVEKNKGKIILDSEKIGSNIIFSVRDNGIGISEEAQKNLFRKFYQIDTSYKRKHGGNGLGLSICKAITDGLKGNIWVESQKGHGATFYVQIPQKLEDAR